MNENTKKVLIVMTGLVIVTLIVVIVPLQRLFPDNKRQAKESYEEVDCGNGKKVYRMPRDRFNLQYSGHDLILDNDIKNKLRTTIGVESVVLQTANDNIQVLLTTAGGLVDVYNASPCGESGQETLKKIKDYITEYGKLSLMTIEIKSMTNTSSQSDANKVKSLIEQRKKAADEALTRLK
jgi:hypothetical protein